MLIRYQDDGLTVTWTAMERDRELSEEHKSKKQTSATFRVEKKKTGLL